MRVAYCVWLLALGVCVPRIGHAQASSDATTSVAAPEDTPASETPTSTAAPGDAKALAVEHYERGRAHYLAGRYREALPELKAALALDPGSPNLAYNVARVNEDLGNLDEAMAYYQRYLALLPKSDKAERAKIELALKRLEGAKEDIAEQRSETALMGFGPTPAPREQPTFGRTDVWFWAAAIGGAGLLTAGGITGLVALKREDDVSRFVVGIDGTFAERDHLGAQADTFALVSDVCFASGGAALAGAALLFFLRAPDSDETEQAQAKLRLSLRPFGAGAQLRAAF